LDTILRSHQLAYGTEVTVFTEFFGAQSFAEQHQPDDPKQLVLFDVQTQTGMLPPEEFIQEFRAVQIARVIYRGKLTGQFVEEVRSGRYGVAEGVICKEKNASGVWRVKIKTNAYLKKLQQIFQSNWEDYWA
jgi:hypothetical protein